MKQSYTELPNKNRDEVFAMLEQGVQAALETYSNVHRGSGHNSMVSTHLFEQAREIVVEYLGLNKGKYHVIFCTPRRAAVLMAKLNPGSVQCVTSRDIGLPLGISTLVVKRKALPKGAPFETGGGTTRLISREWVLWADAPDKFEAGTPAIINVIAFARALRLILKYGKDIFLDPVAEEPAGAGILYHDALEGYSGRELMDKLRQALIGRDILVPTAEGLRPFINLDNGASTPTFSPIWNAVRQAWHQPGAKQEEIIQEVRSICAGVLGAPPAAYDVIFTSNTTEAINLAAESLSRESEEGTESVVLNTLLEHSSNDLPWRMVPRFSLVRLSIDQEGFVDLNELDKLMCAYNQDGVYGNKRIRLVAVSGASNVLGVFNDIGEISRIVHGYGARLLVDAAQMVAHRKVDVEGCGIDYLAFSAHKVYAPFGTGVLVVRKGLLKFSEAEMEQIHSSGEENAGGIAALGKTLVLLQRIGMDLIREEEQILTRRTLQGMAQIRGLTVYRIKDTEAPRFARKGGVILFGLKGIMPNIVAKRLAERGGIGVRYGCHCAHLVIKHLLHVTPAIERIQKLILTLFHKFRLPGLVRVSLGIENSEEEIDTFLRVLDNIAGQPQNLTESESASEHKGTPPLPKAKVQQQMKEFTKAAAVKVYSE